MSERQKKISARDEFEVCDEPEKKKKQKQKQTKNTMMMIYYCQ